MSAGWVTCPYCKTDNWASNISHGYWVVCWWCKRKWTP